ncbi:MAG TPA: gamma-glutamylcyclotransferase family protein, partial [Mucilaginibacter sp.]
MIATHPYIFVYGTLLLSGNEFADYLGRHCTLVTHGKFKGRLYNVGEYPAAVFDKNEKGYVLGNVYIMDDATSVLQVIDEYEGIARYEPGPYEYIR